MLSQAGEGVSQAGSRPQGVFPVLQEGEEACQTAPGGAGALERGGVGWLCREGARHSQDGAKGLSLRTFGQVSYMPLSCQGMDRRCLFASVSLSLSELTNQETTYF